MRIDVEAVARIQEKHIAEGSGEAICERLHVNTDACADYEFTFGPVGGAVATSALVVGVELGMELERSLQPKAVNHPDPETTKSHDEFLESLPEADLAGYLESS